MLRKKRFGAAGAAWSKSLVQTIFRKHKFVFFWKFPKIRLAFFLGGTPPTYFRVTLCPPLYRGVPLDHKRRRIDHRLWSFCKIFRKSGVCFWILDFDFSLDQSISWIICVLLPYEGELLFSATDINSWECLKEVREFTWILNTVGFDWKIDGGIFSRE